MKKLAFAFLFAALCFSCNQSTDSKEVLFVCTHGAARSPIAAAYFNKAAKEQQLNYHAVFRGTEPDNALTKETVAGLTNEQFDISGWKPAKVSTADMDKAYKIVTFDLTLPTTDKSLSIDQWNGTPSISKDYTIARSAIEAKVNAFIKTLPKN